MAKSRQQKRQQQRKKTQKKSGFLWLWIVIGIVLIAAALAIVYLKTNNADAKTDETEAIDTAMSDIVYDKEPVVSGEHDRVKFTMEGGGFFIVELYPEYAPETVENFKKLVSDGFYDGLTFHRVVDGFMAQGGDPNGDGSGGSDKTISGEFYSNGFEKNTLSHQRGIISMARSQDPDSASSQFFICYGDESFLDGDYAAFGKVIEGMEIVDAFLEVPRTLNSIGEEASPKEPIIIKSATIIN